METEFDPRLNEAQKRLSVIIQHAVGGRQMNLHTVQITQNICNEFAATCRMKGIDFPKLVVLPLSRIGQLVIWPANASYFDVQVRIKDLVNSLRRIGKELDVEELSAAIRTVYPDYGILMGGYIESFEEKAKLPIYAQ